MWDEMYSTFMFCFSICCDFRYIYMRHAVNSADDDDTLMGLIHRKLMHSDSFLTPDMHS